MEIINYTSIRAIHERVDKEYVEGSWLLYHCHGPASCPNLSVIFVNKLREMSGFR